MLMVKSPLQTDSENKKDVVLVNSVANNSIALLHASMFDHSRISSV